MKYIRESRVLWEYKVSGDEGRAREQCATNFAATKQRRVDMQIDLRGGGRDALSVPCVLLTRD